MLAIVSVGRNKGKARETEKEIVLYRKSKVNGLFDIRSKRHSFVYLFCLYHWDDITWSTTPAWKGLSQTEKNRKYNQIIFLKDDKQFWMLWRWCSGDTGIGKRRMKVLEDLSPTEGQKLPGHNLLGGHLLEQPQLVALCFK